MTPPLLALLALAYADEAPRPHVAIRGIYGGYPAALFEGDRSPADFGVNAVWIGSGGLDAGQIRELKKRGIKVFAEFNTMHSAEYLKDHPDAAPVGPDGKVCPAPDGWQGVRPTHVGYRRERMAEFRRALKDFDIDGIWLDYHHAHASWEQAEPNLPDTDFHPETIAQFRKETGVKLPDGPVEVQAKELLGPLNAEWTRWRCGVFTDWVREFREIRDEVRPGALLGTFHCPWTDEERDGALERKLGIDLKAQAEHIDVFSIMPYHARFGHHRDPEWIARQVSWLGEHLGVAGKPGERVRIWPIVQLADWGESVRPEEVRAILDLGTRAPATGATIFHWSGLAQDRGKLEAMAEFYRAIGSK